MADITVGAIVYKSDDLDSDYPGTVRAVGSSDNLQAPDVGMALVTWSRTSLRWEYSDDLVLAYCAYFAGCTRYATQTIPHPILGKVPTCDRCKATYDAMA